MKYLQHRKLLRISTFVAVSVGLAMGTSAVASPPADQDEASIQIAQKGVEVDAQVQQQEETDDQLIGDDDERADLPGDIENFQEFVEEHQREGIEDIHEYVNDGAQHMADAMRELLPDDDATGLESQLDNWESRLGALENGERAAYPAITRQLFMEGAEVLTNIQQNVYPGQEQLVQEVMSAAEGIDPEVEITQQVNEVESYFALSSQTIQSLYMARPEPEEPVTQAPTLDLIMVSHPVELAQAEQDDELFEWETEPTDEADLPGDVEDFDEFVQEHRVEGIDHVADYTREASQHYHDAMKALLPDDEELIEEQLDRFQDSVNALDDTVRAEYPRTFRETMVEGTQILTTIQQAYYPQQEAQVREVFNSIEQFDTTRPIEEQVNAIQNIYFHASNATRTMGGMVDQLDEPVTSIDGDAIAQADGYGDEPGQYGDEPADPMDERMGDEHMDDDHMDDEIGAGPALSEEVQSFVDFAGDLSLEELTMEAEEKTVEGMRLLEEALGSLIEEEEPGVEEPGLSLLLVQDRMDEPTYEGDPGWEEEPGLEEEPTDELTQLHDQLSTQIEELEQMKGQEEFGQHLHMSMETAANLLTNIQQEEYPQHQELVQNITEFAEQLDPEMPLEQQGEIILGYFTSASVAVETIETERMEELRVDSTLSMFIF